MQRSTRRIIAGNHRFLAARQAGLTHLPVIWVDCDDDRALRMLLVDNKASDSATYDMKALAALLSELEQTTDEGLAGTGFSAEEVDDLIKSLIPKSLESDDGGGAGGVGDDGQGQHALLILCDNLMDQDEICARLSAADLICRKVVVTEETLTTLSSGSSKSKKKSPGEKNPKKSPRGASGGRRASEDDHAGG